MAEARVDPPKGLLTLRVADERVRLARYVPSAEVGFFVEHYWTVRWDLRGQPPFTSESLPYPSLHVVVEPGLSRVVGVPTEKFQRTVQGKGFVFGIKFRPGGFRPFIDQSVSTLTDRSVPTAGLLDYARALDQEVIAVEHDDELMVERAEGLLRLHLPEADAHIPTLAGIVESIATDRTIVRVEQLVAQFGLGQRALQRLFREYVGVSPKWVIQRYRIFEAADRLSSGEADGAQLAQELGYFDQAHFIRDFKALVGKSPQAFVRDLGGSRGELTSQI